MRVLAWSGLEPELGWLLCPLRGAWSALPLRSQEKNQHVERRRSGDQGFGQEPFDPINGNSRLLSLLYLYLGHHRSSLNF